MPIIFYFLTESASDFSEVKYDLFLALINGLIDLRNKVVSVPSAFEVGVGPESLSLLEGGNEAEI